MAYSTLAFLVILLTIFQLTTAQNFVQCVSLIGNSTSPLILTPENPNFQPTLQFYIRNKRFNLKTTLKPIAIVTPKQDPDVQATVVCAKKLGLQLRIRSGGHDYEGMSYVSDVPFVLLDMSAMRTISINSRDALAWVDSGAILGELYAALYLGGGSRVAFPAGVCPSLGIGGHFAGGGYGTLMRKYGLAVDNAVDVNIVNAKGEVLDRKSMGEDVFWALRGGGGASFGVILRWLVKLVPVPPIVTTFQLDKTLEENATDLVWTWQNIAHKVDENLFIRIQIETVNGTSVDNKTVRVSFIGMYLGPVAEFLPIITKEFPALNITEKDCNPMKWIESTLFFYGMPTGTPIDFLTQRSAGPVFSLKHKSDYVKSPIGKRDLEKIWGTFMSLGDVIMQWNPYGGKMSEIPTSATAFGHRGGNIFKVQYMADWKEDDESAERKYMSHVRKMYDVMAPYVSKNPREAFMNYRDADIGSIGANGNGSFAEAKKYGLKYFKSNFGRLVKVKTAFDPDNFFRYEQSIPVRKGSV